MGLLLGTHWDLTEIGESLGPLQGTERGAQAKYKWSPESGGEGPSWHQAHAHEIRQQCGKEKLPGWGMKAKGMVHPSLDPGPEYLRQGWDWWVLLWAVLYFYLNPGANGHSFTIGQSLNGKKPPGQAWLVPLGCWPCRATQLSLQLPGTWWLAGMGGQSGPWDPLGLWKVGRRVEGTIATLSLRTQWAGHTLNQSCQPVLIRWFRSLAPCLSPLRAVRPPWAFCCFTLRPRSALTTASSLLVWDQLASLILFLTPLDSDLLVFDGRKTRNLTFIQSFFPLLSLQLTCFKTHTQQRILLFGTVFFLKVKDAINYNPGQRGHIRGYQAPTSHSHTHGRHC